MSTPRVANILDIRHSARALSRGRRGELLSQVDVILGGCSIPAIGICARTNLLLCTGPATPRRGSLRAVIVDILISAPSG